jgi:hypothetical protein
VQRLGFNDAFHRLLSGSTLIGQRVCVHSNAHSNAAYYTTTLTTYTLHAFSKVLVHSLPLLSALLRRLLGLLGLRRQAKLLIDSKLCNLAGDLDHQWPSFVCTWREFVTRFVMRRDFLQTSEGWSSILTIS